MALSCTQHTWLSLTETGQYLQDVLVNAPLISYPGLVDAVSIATIVSVSHREAAAIDALFRGWTFPNLTILTLVLGDHSDGIRNLCSMLSTKPHIPAIRCPNVTILTIERARQEPSWCGCGEDGVYALPDEWRDLFKQITVC